MQVNRIIHGDCIEALAQLPENSARLCVADPPYYQVLLGQDWDNSWSSPDEYLAWTARWIDAAMRVLVPGGLENEFVVWITNRR